MDLNTPSLHSPENVNYILGVTKWFWMPQTDGKIVRAVAVTSSQGTIWVAAYALLLILIFVAIARLLKDLIISLFPLRGNGNRYAMLVGYYNTNDPVSIIIIAISYAWKCIVHIKGDGLWGIDWGTFWLAISLVAFALSLLLANAVGGVLVPGNLRLGHVARVSPNSIYYPSFTNETPYALLQRFQGPPAVRAAAANLAQTKAALKGKYNFSSPVWTGGDNPTFSFKYSYTITGLDFGFQRAPGLIFTVDGSCNTDYTWLANSTGDRDTYNMWHNASTPLVVRPVDEAFSLPWAEFLNYKEPQYGHTRDFAVVPHTAGRLGDYANTKDPWYITEAVNSDDGLPPQYRVRSGRPVLLCKQGDTWEYGGHKVMTVSEVTNLTETAGLKLAKFYTELLLPQEFGPPTVNKVANSLGYTALASSIQYSASGGMVDFTATSIQADLERVILAALVYSRDVVRATAFATDVTQGEVPNLAADGSENVPDEVADFVISDGDIATMSVHVLIATPAVCLLLWFCIAVRGWLMFVDIGTKVKNDSYRARYVQRTIAFSCIQLYKYLDEELSGERRWVGRLSFTPYVRDVTAKYNRRYSEFEVIPSSARVSTILPARPPSISRCPSPSQQPGNKAFEDDATFSIDLDPHHQCNDEAEEAVKPLVTPFARPALVPLHQRSSSSPASYDVRKSVGNNRFSFSADMRRPTSDYIPSDDQFELAMTRHWRPSLGTRAPVRWNQVRRE